MVFFRIFICFATKLSKKAENNNENGTNYLKLLHKLYIVAFCSNTTATYGIFSMKSPRKRAQEQHHDKNPVHFATCAYIKSPYRQTQPSQHFHRVINNPVITPVTTKAALRGGGFCQFHIGIPYQISINETDPEKSHVTVWGVEALS